MAAGDGSPTSGGTGDTIVTEDTYNQTLTGTQNVKLAVGKIRVGPKDTDGGDIIPWSNDLPTNDIKLQAIMGQLLESIQAMQDTLVSLLLSQAPLQYQAQGTLVTYQVGSATSVQLLSPNVDRAGASFYNDSTCTGNLYLLFGVPGSKASAVAGGATVRIPPGGYFEMPPNAVHLGPVFGIWDSVTTPGWVDITEYV